MNLKQAKKAGFFLLAGVTAAYGLALATSAEDKPGKAEKPGDGVNRPDPGQLFDKLDQNKDGKLTAEEVGKEKAPLFERLLRTGDQNKDGALSKDEFRDAMKRQDRPREEAERRRDRRPEGGPRRPDREFGPGPGGPRGELFFDLLDRNNDGKISVEEVPERAKMLLRNLLRRADKKEGDTLTKEEFRDLMAAGPGRGPRDGERPRRPGMRDGEGRPGPRSERGEGRRPGPDRERGPRDGGGRPGARFGGPRFFRLLDTNEDRVLSKDELSKAAEKFDELDTNKDGKLDMRELFGPPPEGRGPEGRRGPPEGRGPEGRRGPPEGRGPEGRRGPPEGRGGPRPEENRREPGEGGGRRPDGGEEYNEFLDV